MKKGITNAMVWQAIEKIGWDVDGFADPQLISALLSMTLRKDQLRRVKRFIDGRVDDLDRALRAYETQHGIKLLVVESPEYADVRYHVVGLGECTFNHVLKNPDRLQTMFDEGDFKPGFAQCFVPDTSPTTGIAIMQREVAKIVSMVEVLHTIVTRLAASMKGLNSGQTRK